MTTRRDTAAGGGGTPAERPGSAPASEGGDEGRIGGGSPEGVALDPRAVRARTAPSTALDGDPTLVVGPSRSLPDADGRAIGPGTTAAPEWVVVDDRPVAARLRRLDAVRAILEVAVGDEPVAGGEGPGAGTTTAGEGAVAAAAGGEPLAANRTRVLVGPVRRGPDGRMAVREVVVDGWRFEVAVEPEQRARLVERARRGEAAGAAGGPVEVRAIIPGRVVAVSVAPGDPVVAGQQILVVEAMKMQNELRAPREGSVERVGVAVGDTIEVGDLLVVIH